MFTLNLLVDFLLALVSFCIVVDVLVVIIVVDIGHAEVD